MNLINKQVVHKSFGKGNVVGQDDSYIEISFPSGNKKFVFPDVFDTYLKLCDKIVAASVESLLQKRRVQLKKEEEELEQARQEHIEEKKHQLELRKIMNNNKINPSSQVVFWCDQEEVDKIFTDWKVFTGQIKSGKNKGTPKRLARIHHNSACLLTSRDSDIEEKDRQIIGVFMVEGTFIGKLSEDGYIPAHSKYRLHLSEEESKKMLFWNYYKDEKYPQSTTWNTGRHRYFDNIEMAQILKDIASLKEGTDEQELCQQFFQYFCKVNEINMEKLSERKGALMNM